MWLKVASELKREIPDPAFHSLLQSVFATEIPPDQVSLQFVDPFYQQMFESRWLPAVEQILQKLNFNLKLNLSVLSASAPDVENAPFDLGGTEDPPFEASRSETQALDSQLAGALEFDEVNRDPSSQLSLEKLFSLQTPVIFDPKYTFDTFVVGTSNQFAHAAAMAVVNQPGRCYNPLFIFGRSGLGKTHLLKAIGYDVFKKNPTSRIFYLTTESFTNELIQAIRLDKMRDFRNKYRQNCDLLLLDDIQFLEGKERTKEEFFYTFNYLHESKKQIVITSDRYPKDIQGLEERLKTRFEWGLVTDIHPPEIETRVAILQNKARDENITLPDDAAQFIASQVTSNVRELEGYLHRVQSYASIVGTGVSVDLARRILKDVSVEPKKQITPEGILKLVALEFNVKASELKSNNRIRKLTIPRQIAMYLLRKHLLLSFPEIGRILGGKNHTTVLYGVSKVAELYQYKTRNSDVLSLIKRIHSIEGLLK